MRSSHAFVNARLTLFHTAIAYLDWYDFWCEDDSDMPVGRGDVQDRIAVYDLENMEHGIPSVFG